MKKFAVNQSPEKKHQFNWYIDKPESVLKKHKMLWDFDI